MRLNSLLFISTAAILVTGGSGYWFFSRDKEEIKWRFGKVDRGDIIDRVTATGTLSALLQVDVGTQVSGMVTSINADFNSIVKKDQVIATMDPTLYEQRVRTEEIRVEQSRTSLVDAERNYRRYQELSKNGMVSDAELESRELTYRNAKATHENNIISLEQAKTNLEYCTIKSPLDGVVVSRKADVGQTVQASMTTPSLFIIAEDLSKMKLEISIDEADISKLEVGQVANFRVDSVEDAEFRGAVSQVRLEPTTQQSVVSYKVVVEVENQTKEQVEAQKEVRRSRMGGFGGRGQGNNPSAPNADGKPAEAKPNATPGAVPQNAGGRSPEAQQSQQPPQSPQTGSGERRGMAMGSDGQPDYDVMWERMKDNLLQNRPDLTKEVFIKEAKERRQQRMQQGGEGREGRGSMRTASDGARNAVQQSQQRPASQPSSNIIKAGGAFYRGEYVLRPGMTANVTIITKQKNAVLRVPNIALRFNASTYIQPKANDPATPAQQVPQQQQQRPGGGRSRGGVSMPREDRIWILDEKGEPKAVPVKAGLTDNSYIEITGEGISEGMEILLGVDETKKNAAVTANSSPFQMGGPMGGRR